MSDIVKARPLAATEFLHPGVPVEVGFVFGHRGVLAVGVGVIADFMLGDRGNYILTLALLKHSRLLPHHLEGRGNSLLRQKHCDPLGGIVALRQDVVLRVKPEHDVNLPLRGNFRLGALLPGTANVGNVDRGRRGTLARRLPKSRYNAAEQNRRRSAKSH